MAARKQTRRKFDDAFRQKVADDAREHGIAFTVERYGLARSVVDRCMRKCPAAKKANGAAHAEPPGDVQALAAQLGEALARVKALKKALREALGD